MYMDLGLPRLSFHCLCIFHIPFVSQELICNSGIMQLAMLAPYSNLATSVAAALVPTLLGPAKMKGPEESEPANVNKNAEEAPTEGGKQQTFYYKSLRNVCKSISH